MEVVDPGETDTGIRLLDWHIIRHYPLSFRRYKDASENPCSEQCQRCHLCHLGSNHRSTSYNSTARPVPRYNQPNQALLSTDHCCPSIRCCSAGNNTQNWVDRKDCG